MFETLAPYIGYTASLLLMIGLLVTTDLKFRIWNGLGCLFFIFYAIIIGAMPVLLTNAVLLAINIFYFIKIINRKEFFDTTYFESGDALAEKFLEFYKDDILRYFPNFNKAAFADNINVMVLRDLVIANMYSGRLLPDGSLQVALNYTVPKYRDYKVGRYLFGAAKDVLLQKGVNTVVYEHVALKSHETFLIKSGFERQGDKYFKIL